MYAKSVPTMSAVPMQTGKAVARPTSVMSSVNPTLARLNSSPARHAKRTGSPTPTDLRFAAKSRESESAGYRLEPRTRPRTADQNQMPKL